MFRKYLCVATCLAALACIPVHAEDLLSDQGLAQCFVKATAATPMIAAKHKTGPFRIAFSNSLYGNNWRTEMLNAVGAYVKQPDVATHISEFKIYNAGNDVSQQISQIREMILAGYDAIVINAASPSGLNSVINQAVAQGIVVVSFDNVVTTAKAINVNEDQRE